MRKIYWIQQANSASVQARKYVIHYKNLKYVHNLGVNITKLHKAISCTQSTWLKSYIEFNHKKRRDAKYDFLNIS